MFLPHIDFRFRLLGGVIIMKKSFWVPFLALAGSLIFSITALAGEVNSAEQKIVDAISGTYEYDGAQYRVTDAYIAKVANYLSRDDVNMTDSEARGYIRQFNENIAVGISSGYMVKVEESGGSEEPDTETEDAIDEGDNDKDNELDTDKDKNTGNGDSSNGSNSENKESGNSGIEEDKVTSTSSTENNSTDGNTGTGSSSIAGDNTGADNGITAGDLGILTPDGNALSGFFSQAESGTETGVIEDNTIGSTTDGEIEYTVFPIDKTAMYVWDIDTLDVHAEAYKDSDVIGTLNKGDAVTITGAATTGWAQIDYNGETGYVSAVYLRTQGYMSTLEESEITNNEADSKDYSDAAPLRKSFNFGTIAIVIVIVCIIGSGIIIMWHRNKRRKR